MADGLSRYAEALSTLADRADRMAALDDATIEAIVQAAIVRADLESVARAHLSRNLRASGVGTLTRGYQSTGRLRRAIAGVEVSATYRRGRALELELRMPPGQAPYTDSSAGTPAYTVWGSLNYGAVRMPRGGQLGEKAKRSIKKLASGGTMSRRSRDAIARQGVAVGGVSGSRGRGTQVETSHGEANVLPPRKFFYLNASQWGDLEARFAAALEETISRAIGGGGAAARSQTA